MERDLIQLKEDLSIVQTWNALPWTCEFPKHEGIQEEADEVI